MTLDDGSQRSYLLDGDTGGAVRGGGAEEGGTCFPSTLARLITAATPCSPAVIMSGGCQGEGYRVGFGECRGRVLPALER